MDNDSPGQDVLPGQVGTERRHGGGGGEGGTDAPSLWVVDGRQGQFMTPGPDRLGLKRAAQKEPMISVFVPDLTFV